MTKLKDGVRPIQLWRHDKTGRSVRAFHYTGGKYAAELRRLGVELLSTDSYGVKRTLLIVHRTATVNGPTPQSAHKMVMEGQVLVAPVPVSIDRDVAASTRITPLYVMSLEGFLQQHSLLALHDNAAETYEFLNVDTDDDRIARKLGLARGLDPDDGTDQVPYTVPEDESEELLRIRDENTGEFDEQLVQLANQNLDELARERLERVIAENAETQAPTLEDLQAGDDSIVMGGTLGGLALWPPNAPHIGKVLSETEPVRDLVKLAELQYGQRYGYGDVVMTRVPGGWLAQVEERGDHGTLSPPIFVPLPIALQLYLEDDGSKGCDA